MSHDRVRSLRAESTGSVAESTVRGVLTGRGYVELSTQEALEAEPEAEQTAMFRDFPANASADDLARGAEAFAAVGVSTLVASAVGDDPAATLESTFGPVVDRIATIEPSHL